MTPYSGNSLCSHTADIAGTWQGAELAGERMFQEEKEELDPTMITRVWSGIWGLSINIISSH